jgi:hypothetical protein
MTLRSEAKKGQGAKHNVPHLEGILQLLGITELKVVQNINL